MSWNDIHLYVRRKKEHRVFAVLKKTVIVYPLLSVYIPC